MANICPCTMGNSISHALNNLRNARKLKELLPEQTGHGIVISRKVDTCYTLEKSDSSWGFFVTFQLEDGREIELKAEETDYKKLKEGASLAVTWQGDQLVQYILEER